MTPSGRLFILKSSLNYLTFFSVIGSKAVISSVALNLVYSPSWYILTSGFFRGVFKASRTAVEGRLTVFWDSRIMVGTGFKRFGVLVMSSGVTCLLQINMFFKVVASGRWRNLSHSFFWSALEVETTET